MAGLGAGGGYRVQVQPLPGCAGIRSLSTLLEPVLMELQPPFTPRVNLRHGSRPACPDGQSKGARQEFCVGVLCLGTYFLKFLLPVDLQLQRDRGSLCNAPVVGGWGAFIHQCSSVTLPS